MDRKMQTVEEPKVKVQDVVTLTARLAQILAEEVDLLNNMHVSKIADLQKEKLFLINALEAQRKLLDRHPHLSESIPSQDKRDLEDVVSVFNDILEENHHKLLLAKKVNHEIVKAITSVVQESTKRASYSVRGMSEVSPFQTLSVTLDKTI
ncbi:MAG: hypothetical protein ACK502_00635 [Alphaproteobacteria bacterium]